MFYSELFDIFSISLSPVMTLFTMVISDAVDYLEGIAH